MADRTCKTSDGVYTTMRENYSNRTQEQDIVERLQRRAKFDMAESPYRLMEEAAQTIAALRAERDEWKRTANSPNSLQEMQERYGALQQWKDALALETDDYENRLFTAEAKVKELEAEISNLDAELDHWSQLAVDDLGKNPPTSWKEIADTAIRERDELRKALEPFAMAADELDDKDEDRYEIWEHPVAMNITIGDVRRARASSNREGGEE